MTKATMKEVVIEADRGVTKETLVAVVLHAYDCISLSIGWVSFNCSYGVWVVSYCNFLRIS